MQKIAMRLRIRPPKRRNPAQRLHARLYYRKNRAKIRMQRRRYLRIHRTQIKHRKMFMRYKPTWFKKPRRPTHHVKKPKKFKLHVPKTKKTKHLKLFKPHKVKKFKTHL